MTMINTKDYLNVFTDSIQKKGYGYSQSCRRSICNMTTHQFHNQKNNGKSKNYNNPSCDIFKSFHNFTTSIKYIGEYPTLMGSPRPGRNPSVDFLSAPRFVSASSKLGTLLTTLKLLFRVVGSGGSALLSNSNIHHIFWHDSLLIWHFPLTSQGSALSPTFTEKKTATVSQIFNLCLPGVDNIIYTKLIGFSGM